MIKEQIEEEALLSHRVKNFPTVGMTKTLFLPSSPRFLREGWTLKPLAVSKSINLGATSG